MATYSKETALYNTGAIQEGIDEAAGTVNKYITDIGSDGIKVHPEDYSTTVSSKNNYTLIDGDGMGVVKNGQSVAKFAETTILGRLHNLRLKLAAGIMSLLNDSDDTVFSVKENATGTVTRNASVVTFADSTAIDQTTRYVTDNLVVDGDVTVNFNTGGDSFVLSSSECTTVVTPGSSVSVALTQAGADRALELMTAASEEAGESVSATIDVDYTISHFDEALMSMDGSATISGEGLIMNVNNNTWSSDNTSETFIAANNTQTGKGVRFGVGSGGQNRGVYDKVADRWMIYSDEDCNTKINGNNFTLSSAGNIATNGWLSLRSNNKSISFADKNGTPRAMLYISPSDYFGVGYGLYSQNKGETRIYGDTIRLYTHNSIDFNAGATFSGDVEANRFTTPNNHGFRSNNTSGTPLPIVGLNSNDYIWLGDDSYPLVLAGNNISFGTSGNLKIDGTITVGNHASSIGTIVTGTRYSSAGTSGTSYSTQASIKLSAGKWHISAFASFNGGTAGTRRVLITDNSSATTDAGIGSCTGYAPADTQIMVRSEYNVELTDEKTYYLRIRSGTSVNSPYGNLTAVRYA